MAPNTFTSQHSLSLMARSMRRHTSGSAAKMLAIWMPAMLKDLVGEKQVAEFRTSSSGRVAHGV